MVAALIAVLLSQDPELADAGVPLTPEEKAAQTLERLTVATEKLAAAAERQSPPPAPDDKPAAPPVGTHWDFYTNAGLNWSTGNISSVSFIGSGGGIRKGEKTIAQFKIWAGYGQKFNPPAAPATVGSTDILLYNAGGTGQLDYRFNQAISAFIGTGVDTDHVKSVELRGYGDLGVGVLWLDKKEAKYQKLYLKTDLNIRLQDESRFQYYPTPAQLDDAVLLGPRVALSFRYAMNAGTYIGEELEVIPNVIGPTAGRVLLNSDTKLAVGIAAHVALAALFTFKYDSQPAAGKQPLDTLVTVALEATF